MTDDELTQLLGPDQGGEPNQRRLTGPVAAAARNPGITFLILISYVPLLLTKRGMVGADTKTYLYLDPGRLLSRAPFMWDPNIGLGTVTHQNIGYLWPMGPYYFVMDAIGVPDWIAQRLWMGSILLAAGLGVRWMLKEIGWRTAGVTVASFAYALSPYVLEYAARISVILLPFAGLPWLIGLAARSLRVRDWRAPAAFALVTLTVGGVNATSLILVMFGPVLWFVYATFALREVTLREALVAGWRITVLTFITSLWWLAGLMIQGRYGIDILRYTESYRTVAQASVATELYRGLGYWFFYGQDGLGAWTESSITYVQSRIVLPLSYLIPWLGFMSGLITRWRTRLYFALLIITGLVIGVGAHPWDSPSPYGSVFKAWSRSDLGLSFRSTPRAAPLIVLGLAVFLGAGLSALQRWRPAVHRVASAGLLVLILVNMLPLFRGQFVDRYLMRPNEVPEYWTDAAQAVSRGSDSTRIMEIPGIDFASYRWGNTVDPIMPGLTDRPYVARELIPYGTPPSANLLNAVDAPAQSGRADPTTWAPLARLMGVGEIVFRADLQYERYLTPRPRDTWAQLLSAPGLGAPLEFGAPDRNEASDVLPVDDNRNYAIPLDAEDPPPVAVFPVEEPRSILRTIGATNPFVLSGDGDGIVAMASAAMLDPNRLILYSGTVTPDQEMIDRLVDDKSASLVITDTNRRSARRWGGVRDNSGHTERVGEEPLLEDVNDNRLSLFPFADSSAQTVSEQIGGATLTATRYGNDVAYTPGDRAVNAMDDDESTAWRVAAFAEAEGHYLEIDLHQPVTTDHLELLQVQGPKNRYMTEVSLTFDDGEPMRIHLEDSSRTAPGQTISFPQRRFEHLRVTVEETDRGPLVSYRGISDVGIAELRIPGVEPVQEVIRPPVDLITALGKRSIDSDLTYIFTRRASNPADVLAADEEPSLARRIDSPAARMFTVFGKGRLAVGRDDGQVDRTLGLPSAAEGGVTATSSGRMAGTLRTRARSAVDDDLTTAYITPITDPYQHLTFAYPAPVTVDELTMLAMDTDKYSVPSQIRLGVDGRDLGLFDLDSSTVGRGTLASESRTLHFATGAITGRSFTIEITGAEERRSKDWFSGSPLLLPAAIIEVGLPQVPLPDPGSTFDTGCRDDLAALDGEPVPVRMSGTFGAASSGATLEVKACSPGLSVPSGTSVLTTTKGTATGFDLDMIGLASDAGGVLGADPLEDASSGSTANQGQVGPSIHERRTGRLSYDVEVGPSNKPYWVVLGQSNSDGWTATTSDGVDLGPPVLVNGFANGWYVDPTVHGESVQIELRWAPQRSVWIGLALSALGVLICLALMIHRPRQRRGPTSDTSIVPRFIEWRRVPDARGAGRPRAFSSAVSVVVATAAGVFFAGPIVGIVTGVGCLLALTSSVGRWLVRFVSIATLAASMVYVIVTEAIHRYPLDFRWADHFEITHSWSMGAGMLMLVSIAVDMVVHGGERSMLLELRTDSSEVDSNSSEADPDEAAD